MKRPGAAAAAALVVLKVAAMLWAKHCGFQQISDDDYARTVIAQTFAHAPRLDPSQTSWLPFPFWIYGVAMIALGRSLAVARGVAFALGALAPLVPYAGLRSMRISPVGAAIGAALASLTPWSVWLGLAPVPEGWAGLCAAAALFFLASGAPRNATISGALAFAASLSRYEAWPIAAFVGIVCAVRLARRGEGRAWLAAGAFVAVLGPVLWLANNAVAHGDAFHFIARVTAYRREHGGAIPLAARLLEYPRALASDAPEIVLGAAVGAFALRSSPTDPPPAGRRKHPMPRSRWVLPLAGGALVFAFLVYGDVRDGAPTHHAARALVSVFGVLGGLAGDGLASLAQSRRSAVALGVAAAAWLAFVLVRARDVPGSGDDARREAQIERGKALAASATAFEVTPCAYEHFALIAAFGAPERVTILPSSHAPVTPDCPRVSIR